MLRVARRLAVVMLVLSAACAEPPNKEMNQAQGAIDAARAAGADKFAADEFKAAHRRAPRSEDAVVAGDYRQALNHALDSRERAQNAAKTCRRRPRRRARPGRTGIAEVATLLSQADRPAQGPRRRPAEPARVKGPRSTVESAAKDAARSAHRLAAEDYAKRDAGPQWRGSRTSGGYERDRCGRLAAADARKR